MKNDLAASQRISCLKDSTHFAAMLRALRNEGDLFSIDYDTEAGTCVATIKETGSEVFRAIEKEKKGNWIVSHHKDLFV